MSAADELELMQLRALIELRALYCIYLLEATEAHESRADEDAWAYAWASDRAARASRARCRGLVWIICGRYPPRFT